MLTILRERERTYFRKYKFAKYMCVCVCVCVCVSVFMACSQVECRCCDATTAGHFDSIHSVVVPGVAYVSHWLPRNRDLQEA